MSKRLYISLIFSNLVVLKTLSSNHRMYNLYTKFVKILEICKQFSENLVNESGNVPRRGPVPKFSELEVVVLSLTAETESIVCLPPCRGSHGDDGSCCVTRFCVELCRFHNQYIFVNP